MQLWSDDIETDATSAGENVKIKLQGVEEEVTYFYSLCIHFGNMIFSIFHV